MYVPAAYYSISVVIRIYYENNFVNEFHSWCNFDNNIVMVFMHLSYDHTTHGQR